MKTNDKDLLVNPLADVKPPRVGPTFVEKKTESVKKIWSLIKEAAAGWSFGGGHEPLPPPPRGGLSGLDRFRPGAPMPKVKRPKCERCGTNDCLSREDMQRLRHKNRSGTGIGNDLLRSCEVRRQLKAMDKFKVRTSSGDEVWMTKQGRIERPKRPPPPPNPPPIRKHDTELEALKTENEALKQLVKDEIQKQKETAEDKEMIRRMKNYHETEAMKRTRESAEGAELLRRIQMRKRTRPPVR